MSLGNDPHARGRTIDYGSSVEAGTVLAQVDSARMRSVWSRSRLGVALGEAELVQAQAKLELAEAQWRLAQKSHEKGDDPESDFVTAKFNYRVAKAAVAAAEAALAQKKAALKEAQLKLELHHDQVAD